MNSSLPTFGPEPTGSQSLCSTKLLAISADGQEITTRYYSEEPDRFITAIEPIANFASIRGLIGGELQKELGRKGDSGFGQAESNLSVKDMIQEGKTEAFRSGKKGGYHTRSSNRVKAKEEEGLGRNENTEEYQSYVAMLKLVPGPPITLKNTVNDTPSPDPSFKFISESKLDEGISEPDAGFMAGCDCPGGCKPDTCSCNYDYRGLSLEWLEDSGFAYDENGRVTRPNNIGITECNMLCKCSIECQNRVIQRGRTVKLEIFMTRECGWGLRTLEPILKGTYIDSYLGLVITRAEAERREAGYRQSGLSYLFDLDFFEKSMNCGMEKTLEALEIIENPETPDLESAEAQPAAPLQKKRRRTTYFRGSRKRRTRGPYTAGNGRGKQNKKEVEELSEYEEIGEYGVKRGKALYETEEFGESSRAASHNRPIKQKSEVSSGYKLERSASTTPEDYRLRSYSLDSKDMGNVTRFSNHSCDPNLDIYSVVTGSHEIFTLALFANRDIAAGSELTFSYSGNAGLERAKEKQKLLKSRKNKKGGEDTELFRCRCGTRKCVGFYWN
ncbi:unnamed protein product [Tuber aestivum]|uniref:SET domain-containing protein n=1 Tax=Tuber aestivum TaxID=59557 RepID=A0A292PMD5_9PEZI|nr:unnamed protein product [Tuber aestivum]